MNKRALLAGVNDYKEIGDLNGCVNDTTNMRNLLRNYFGFTNADIRVLVDNRATKNNILERLEWMVSGAQPGDLLVFHFSGHGSQIRDRNGDELEDHMDELLCPWDMNWDGMYILDDDLDATFRKLKDGVHLEVFIDSCHSGTALRDLTFGRPDDLGPPSEVEAASKVKSRYLPPPADIKARYEGEEALLSPNKQIKPKGYNNVLWASCASDQTSADAFIKGSYNGAFTYYLCKHVRETDGKIKRSLLLQRLRDSLKHHGYSQIPQLDIENKDMYEDYFLTPNTNTGMANKDSIRINID